MLWSLLVVGLLGSALGGSDTLSPDLVLKSVDRNIDLTTQLAKINYKISIENTGKSAVKYFLFSLDPSFKSKVLLEMLKCFFLNFKFYHRLLLLEQLLGAVRRPI